MASDSEKSVKGSRKRKKELTIVRIILIIPGVVAAVGVNLILISIGDFSLGSVVVALVFLFIWVVGVLCGDPNAGYYSARTPARAPVPAAVEPRAAVFTGTTILI